jgi:hypothetical protein
MFSSDTDTFRLLTRERSHRLMREADAERFARKAREAAGKRPGRVWRLPLAAGLVRSARRRSV